MLSNAYFLAKFRFDTAENEPAKILKKFTNFSNFAKPNPLSLRPLAAGEPALGGGMPKRGKTPPPTRGFVDGGNFVSAAATEAGKAALALGQN